MCVKPKSTLHTFGFGGESWVFFYYFVVFHYTFYSNCLFSNILFIHTNGFIFYTFANETNWDSLRNSNRLYGVYLSMIVYVVVVMNESRMSSTFFCCVVCDSFKHCLVWLILQTIGKQSVLSTATEQLSCWREKWTKKFIHKTAFYHNRIWIHVATMYTGTFYIGAPRVWIEYRSIAYSIARINDYFIYFLRYYAKLCINFHQFSFDSVFSLIFSILVEFHDAISATRQIYYE